MNRIPQDPVDTLKQETREQQDQIEFELSFFEGILNRDPQNVRVLVALAENYSILGSYRKSLPLDIRLTQLCPERPVFWYNLACSYSRLKMLSEALDALSQALANGYDDFPHLLRDGDLKALRIDPRFIRMIEKHLESQRLEVNNSGTEPETTD